jgi:hypothetical protein
VFEVWFTGEWKLLLIPASFGHIKFNSSAHRRLIAWHAFDVGSSSQNFSPVPAVRNTGGECKDNNLFFISSFSSKNIGMKSVSNVLILLPFLLLFAWIFLLSYRVVSRLSMVFLLVIGINGWWCDLKSLVTSFESILSESSRWKKFCSCLIFLLLWPD